MKNYRVALLAFTLTSIAALVSANAADMYRAPEPFGGGYKDGPAVQSWAGFYVGVNGGYGWNAGNDKVTANAFDNDAPPAPFSASSQAGLDSNGGFGGGQIGYNWQGIWHPRAILGIEADIQGSGINGKAKTDVEADPAEAILLGGEDVHSRVSAQSKLDWFGTARGRLGYAFDRTLVYATAGLAYGHVNDSLTTSVNFGRGPLLAPAKTSETRTGFVLGGGLEYAITPAWSLKGEYQFIDLGSSTLASSLAINQFNTEVASGTAKIEHSYNTVRAGLNYHIAPAYEPLK